MDEERTQMNQQDRDILIEIRTIVSKNEERFIEHMKEDAEIQGDLKRSLSSIHRRVDWLMISGVMAILLMAVAYLSKLQLHGQ